ncbi:MAG: DUF4112 domain-containing protein [Candidatus Gracilibacteria bacterium]
MAKDLEKPDNKSIKEKIKEGSLSQTELKRIEKGVKRAELLATVLDTTMIDPIAGIFEGAGDVATGLAGLYIVYEAQKAGMSYWELAKMLGRQTLDLAGGSIPIVGDTFDFVYKSNKANAEALRHHFEKIREQGLTNKLTKLEKLEKKKIKTEKSGVKTRDRFGRKMVEDKVDEDLES